MDGMQNEHTTSADPIPVVVADVFERGSGVPAALERLGARVSIEALTAGDYRIGGGIVVERKTVAELHGSLGRGRLWAQVGKIRDEAVTPILLIEGDNLDAGPRHPNAVRGALLAIFELGVGLLWSSGPADSALWLHRLAVRHARKTVARRPRATSEAPMPGIEVLAAVPGISSRTARVLLERFGSVAGLLDAGPERWAEVDGIGTVRAHSLAVALLNGDARNGSPLSPARRVWRGSSVP
jgi:DNA excision repair protein ERCC-4